MKRFHKKVDMRSRESMTSFLAGHERYNTMNSWNNATSYANCIKVHRLNLPPDVQEVMFDMLEHFDMRDVFEWYAMENSYYFQAGQNGRSGGYIVMYTGGLKDSGYKSFCVYCGQRNYKTVEETNGCKCGRCGKDGRRNHTFNVSFTDARGLDHHCDYDPEDWTMDDLRSRVKEVQAFDEMCDCVVESFIDFCRTHKVEEQEILVPKTIRVAVEV